MKWFFRILVIAVLAMALGVFMRANSGYVQIAVPKLFSLEGSLNFFIVALLVAFFIFYLLLRNIGRLWHFPGSWRRQRSQKRQTRASRKQNEALLALWREDYAGARQAIGGSAAAADAEGVSVLLAAQAAVRLGDDEAARQLLQQPVLKDAEYEAPRTLIEAERLLRQRCAAAALPLLRDLRARTGLRANAGRLELQALRALGQQQEMAALLADLQRHNKMSEAEARSWLSGSEELSAP